MGCPHRAAGRTRLRLTEGSPEGQAGCQHIPRHPREQGSGPTAVWPSGTEPFKVPGSPGPPWAPEVQGALSIGWQARLREGLVRPAEHTPILAGVSEEMEASRTSIPIHPSGQDQGSSPPPHRAASWWVPSGSCRATGAPNSSSESWGSTVFSPELKGSELPPTSPAGLGGPPAPSLTPLLPGLGPPGPPPRPHPGPPLRRSSPTLFSHCGT